MAHRLILTALAALLIGVPSEAVASGYPPLTQPDAVTVTIDSRVAQIDLGANDVDPEGDPLRFVGTDGDIPDGVRILEARGSGAVDVAASSFPGPGDSSGATPGTYVIRTYVYDGTNMAASSLTVTVLPSPGTAVTLEKKKRAGRVVVRNDNDTAIRFLWGAEDRRHADGSVDVPAHGARTIRIYRKSVVTLILTGTEYAVGIKRHLKVPRDGTALPPGLEEGHGLFSAYGAKWVRKLT